MAHGWGVITAGLYGQGKKAESPDMDMKIPKAQAERTSYDERQYDKESGVKMLPGDARYFLEGIGSVKNIRDRVKKETHDWFMNNDNEPPAEMQRKWNEQLAGADLQEIKLRSLKAFFEDRYTRYGKLYDEFYKDGKSSTSGRPVVTNSNGTYLPFIGKRNDGSIGMLSGDDLINYNAVDVGLDKNGIPKSIEFPASMNYTGAWKDYVQTTFQNTSNMLQQGNAGYVNVGNDVVKNGDKFMQILISQTNEPLLLETAKRGLFDSAPESAKLDLMTSFMENIGGAGYAPEDKEGKKLIMEHDSQYIEFDENETKSIKKMVSHQPLDNEDIQNLNKAQKKYASASLAALIPIRSKIDQSVELKKNNDGPDGSGSGGNGMELGFWGLMNSGIGGQIDRAQVTTFNTDDVAKSASDAFTRRWTMYDKKKIERDPEYVKLKEDYKNDIATTTNQNDKNIKEQMFLMKERDIVKKHMKYVADTLNVSDDMVDKIINNKQNIISKVYNVDFENYLKSAFRGEPITKFKILDYGSDELRDLSDKNIKWKATPVIVDVPTVLQTDHQHAKNSAGRYLIQPLVLVHEDDLKNFKLKFSKTEEGDYKDLAKDHVRNTDIVKEIDTTDPYISKILSRQFPKEFDFADYRLIRVNLDDNEYVTNSATKENDAKINPYKVQPESVVISNKPATN